MGKYFPEPKSFVGKVRVELGVDTSAFTKKVDLESLISN